MVILRQKEFGNKANKIKIRQWQMTQAVNPVIQHQSMGGIPQEQILKNSERYKKAIEINKVLPSSEYDNPSISKVDKRLGNAQQTLLQQARGYGQNTQDRGVKKIRGTKVQEKIKTKQERIQALSPENQKKFRQSVLERKNRVVENPSPITNTTIPTNSIPKNPLNFGPTAPKTNSPLDKGTSRVTKSPFKLGRTGKIMAGTALAAGALYGAKKFYDKKKEKE